MTLKKNPSIGDGGVLIKERPNPYPFVNYISHTKAAVDQMPVDSGGFMLRGVGKRISCEQSPGPSKDQESGEA